jgi:acyl-CoA synthetase (AMP-forming)/AMP-acid ligase II
MGEPVDAGRLDDLVLGPRAPTEGPAVITEGGEETTWAELAAAAREVAEDLRSVGVGSGGPVGVSLANGPAAIAAWFGIWSLGGVVVPVNPRLTGGERQHVLDSVHPAAVVDPTGVHPVTGAAVADAGVALISFTSGTTGRPKPVPLRHDAVLDLMDSVLATIRRPSGQEPPRPPMPNLIPVSLSLWAGIYNVLFSFRVGAPAVVMQEFRTDRFAELVAAHGIRSTVLPPPAMVMLSDDPGITDLAPLRIVRSITAPLSPLQARRFRERFGVTVLNGYGQTELGGEVIGWSAADGREFGDDKLGAVGRPHPGVEARVGADGELEVRTARMASAVVADRLTADGYLRTGDIASIDDDGFVWIEGRVSDMVNRGGLKVFPAEVEEVLRLHPSVVDVVVVGEPDDRLGEVPVAHIVSAEPLDEPALDAHCRAHLAPYKVPVRFGSIATIPRTEVGKVRRQALPSTRDR